MIVWPVAPSTGGFGNNMWIENAGEIFNLGLGLHLRSRVKVPLVVCCGKNYKENTIGNDLGTGALQSLAFLDAQTLINRIGTNMFTASCTCRNGQELHCCKLTSLSDIHF